MRVAYFPDSFHEVNGVAHTSRQFEAYARRRGMPFLSVRAGDRTERHVQESQVESLELKRGFLSFALEKDLRFDLGFLRHLPYITRTVRAFNPDIIHITGPSELGMIGAWLAHSLQVPLVASWHTNVHEYAAKRSSWFLRFLPVGHSTNAAMHIKQVTLAATARFYKLAQILFAPNVDLCGLLERKTGRRCLLMPRGVDTQLFSPAHRKRSADDDEFVLGFVGRLSIEKNVMLFKQIGDQLLAAGLSNFRFLIIGHGTEEAWLRENVPRAELPGVLRGAELSTAYANMDLFVFPSHTDTFGNVVLEALASGVPAIVTPDGGPCHIVRDGETGLIAEDTSFAAAVASILEHPQRHSAMRRAARQYALTASWDAVFEGVYEAYEKVAPKLARNVAWRAAL
ncbi:putative glycosyl transferase, group 1 family protein [Acidisarcina polymorpha]|uniref:Putative glycosyl transferase, group 1 family protein n=1 Tax=Acidisarcina polymorpha TaxID=2211140 RepID=A0A2Z5FWX1_9BACT|nr:glycosyltransferase [Acidisarcina polymorpha]AXC11014.1 putative glycosyl transferase, group 1 family protein [Acidisarcina polymorpha]